MADFVIGSLKLRLQFVHPLLTLLQFALVTQERHKTLDKGLHIEEKNVCTVSSLRCYHSICISFKAHSVLHVCVCAPGVPGSWCRSHLVPAAAGESDCAAWSPPSPGRPTAACTAAAPPADSPSETQCPRSAGSAGPSAYAHTHICRS